MNEGLCIGGCGKTLDEDYFCFGCKSFICDDCDRLDPGHMGPHPPEAHLIDREDDDDA